MDILNLIEVLRGSFLMMEIEMVFVYSLEQHEDSKTDHLHRAKTDV